MEIDQIAEVMADAGLTERKERCSGSTRGIAILHVGMEPDHWVTGRRLV